MLAHWRIAVCRHFPRTAPPTRCAWLKVKGSSAEHLHLVAFVVAERWCPPLLRRRCPSYRTPLASHVRRST
eukprot:14824848-Alexandrium_andersonii.AAC.1